MAGAQLDAIVSTCSVMQQAIPCNAVLIQRELGLGDSGIAAFDVNATCLSFVTALELVAAMIAVGRYRHVLIVASEMPSAGLNPADPVTAGLFGDGAAAAVVGRTPAGESSALLAGALETYGNDAELCQLRAGGTAFPYAGFHDADRAAGYFEMDGPGLYRRVARRLPGFFDALLTQAGLDRSDLACVIPHQASGKGLKHVDRTLRLAPGQLVRIIETCGNQVAASIPHALHRAIRSGALVRGQATALLGTGAGLSFGGAILRY